MLAENIQLVEILPAIVEASAGLSTGPRRGSSESVTSNGKKKKQKGNKSLTSETKKKKNRAESSADEFVTPRKEPVPKKIVSN